MRNVRYSEGGGHEAHLQYVKQYSLDAAASHAAIRIRSELEHSEIALGVLRRSIPRELPGSVSLVDRARIPPHRRQRRALRGGAGEDDDVGRAPRRGRPVQPLRRSALAPASPAAGYGERTASVSMRTSNR